MIRRLALSLSLFAVAVLLGSCGKKAPTLNLLVWEGYADPSFVHAFEEKYHCKVSASYMGSSDELVAKLRGGSAGNYDVISPSSDVATSIAEAGLALPLDLSQIPSYGQLSPQLTSLRPGPHQGTGVRRALHVGTGSADLRHHGFPEASGELDRVLGIRSIAARFQCGTIFRPCTWRPRSSAMTSPTLRNSTT